SQSDFISQTKLSEDANLQTIKTFDDTHISEEPTKHRSTALINSGVATSTGETSAFQSTVANNNNTINHNTSNFDEATNLPRKFQFPNLIQFRKTDTRNKFDTKICPEDLKLLSEVATALTTNKFKLTSNSLPQEIAFWYKKYQETFSSTELYKPPQLYFIQINRHPRESIRRRNKMRRVKFKRKQEQYTVKRKLDAHWKIKDVKQFLQQNS
ncbi:unnamed protein product, partial [Rotaria sp. Silwood2]